MQKHNVLQLKIELLDFEPTIWRRFLVSDKMTFEDLHLIANFVMGWEDCHLHDFDVAQKVKIVMDNYDDDFELAYDMIESPHKAKCHKENKVVLSEFLNKEKQAIYYTYDFGDDWEHKITLEKINPQIIEAELNYPVCLGGEMACPVEDCGGTPGYERLLKVQKNPKDPEYEDLMEWLGDEPVDPNEFDLKFINKELKKIKYNRKTAKV